MIHFTLETITPVKAAEYLATSRGNRSLRTNQIKKIARDIAAGEMQVTHQGIAFDSSDTLIDGHHRLNAVVMANKSVRMYVARYDREIIDNMRLMVDDTVKRDTKDILRIDRRIVQTARLVIQSKNLNEMGNVPSASEVSHAIDACGSVLQAVQDICVKNIRFRTSAPVRAAVSMLILKHTDHADELFGQLQSFVNLEGLDTVWPSVLALVRYSDNNVREIGAQSQWLMRAWIAFSPSRKHLKLNRVSDQPEIKAEISQTAKAILGGAK